MKLLVKTHTDIIPILLGRASTAFPGEDLMPNLRLCPVVLDEDGDSIPFPGTVSRIGRWQPRLADRDSGQRHEAEIALDRVNEHLGRLADMLEDDDRPRAA